jgi:hypothetical protein
MGALGREFGGCAPEVESVSVTNYKTLELFNVFSNFPVFPVD